MTTSMDRPTDSPAATDPVLRALRRAGGRVTLGDAVSATGLPRDEVETTLKQLLESRRGHLEVGETGTLVYRFDPKLIHRGVESVWRRMARRSWAAFREAFKVWIVLMLVVYFVIFVALLIAAFVASQSKGGGRSRGRGFGLGRRHGGSFPRLWLSYVFWSRGWGWRRPYYGRRWEERYGNSKGEGKAPFIKRVFSFVFGPDMPRPTQAQKDRSVIRLIRARKGVLGTAELVQHTGASVAEADEEMARLMASYAGDVRVSPAGVLTYLFPELMVSAKGPVREREPDPAWRRLELAESLTGNDGKSDALIGGINGFNLLAAASAPWLIFPQLGLGGPLALIGLVWVPLVFSGVFFALPLLRYLGLRRRNRRRQGRNLRKVLLGHVLQASLADGGPGWVSVAGALERARPLLIPAKTGRFRGRRSPPEPNFPPELEWDRGFADQLQALTAEFDGEVEETPQGKARYRFPEIRTQFRESDLVRSSLRLDTQEVGDIVYASDETREEADQREVEAFDREKERQVNLEQYLQSPDRVSYMDDFELVAFEEEMEWGRSLRA